MQKEASFVVSAAEPRIEQHHECQLKQERQQKEEWEEKHIPEEDIGVCETDDSVDRDHFSEVPRPPKEAWLDSQESELGPTKSSYGKRE